MLYADALLKLADASSVDEATKLDIKDAISKQHADEINALSDEEKENRPAPVDRTVSGTAAGAASADQAKQLATQSKEIEAQSREIEELKAAVAALTDAKK